MTNQTCTIDGSGQLLTVEQEGISMPAEYSFRCVNDYVHDTGRQFEDLQCLALGMACEIERLRAQVAQLRQHKNDYMDAAEGTRRALVAEVEALRPDAERYRWLRDKSESLHSFYLSTPIWMTGVRFSPENVDASIDAARDAKEAP